MKQLCLFLAAVLSGLVPISAPAETKTADAVEAEIAKHNLDGMIRSAIGVTRNGTPIPCFITEDDLDPHSEKFRILLIGGLDGNVESTKAVMEALSTFEKFRAQMEQGKEGTIDPSDPLAKALKAFQEQIEEGKQIAVSAIPCVRPDDIGAKDFKPYSFPPQGNAYNQPENDVAHYLWRWTGMHAPDVAIVLWTTGSVVFENPGSSDVVDRVPLLGATAEEIADLGLNLDPEGPHFGGTENGYPFTIAVESDHGNPPGEVAGVNAYRYRIGDGKEGAGIWENLVAPSGIGFSESEARQEIQRRVDRTPIEVAEELANVYGHKFDSVMYIPALAIVGRMRLGELTDDPAALKDAEKLCAPFLSGEKESMPPKGNGSTISGHLVFSELARRTGGGGWTALAKKAADYGFDENGKPKESMPFHSEMSDSVFMGCAILAETGQLTGDAKYFEQCLRHLRFMENLDLRPDGIYRHSPLDEAAWGRGNGFPALGMALSLSALPEDSDEFAAFLESYRNHLTALRKHQDPTGAWHQVIDHEESYREFTSTCMITFAIVRGLRRGWLDAAEWQPVVDKAWTAIKSRIGPDGNLVDVCTGTGKQKSLRDYFDRTAILGRDDRGGAMALLVSTEIAFWERERSK